MRLEELAPRLAHPLLRSLAWLIGSPGLLDPNDARFAGRVVGDAWCEQELARAAPWLLALDRDPQALEDFIATQPTRRLGRLAEALLACWLAQREGVEVLAQNLAVREGARTLGEFDFILRLPESPEVFHWECAVKFYLRTPGASRFACYVGPGDTDTLGAKIDKVFERQLLLGGTPAGQACLGELGVTQAQPRAFIKGWLFYEIGGAGIDAPGLSSSHGRGWWLRAVAGWERALEAQARYVVLPRLHWMAWPWLAAPAEGVSRDEMAAGVSASVAGGEAVMVVQLAEAAGAWREVSRGFVVPAGWGQPAA